MAVGSEIFTICGAAVVPDSVITGEDGVSRLDTVRIISYQGSVPPLHPQLIAFSCGDAIAKLTALQTVCRGPIRAILPAMFSVYVTMGIGVAKNLSAISVHTYILL